jgi:hypothetical protein
VLPLVEQLYERDPIGCCWTAVFTHGYDSDPATYGIVENRVARCTHPDCQALAKLLPFMSPGQRRSLYAKLQKKLREKHQANQKVG